MDNTTNSTNQDWSTPPIAAYVALTIGVLSVIFNGLLIVVMVLNSKQIFASLGSYFIMNLAIADFITGINTVYWAFDNILHFNTGVVKSILLSIFWLTVEVSFYTIFVMSTERLIAIVFPFRASLLMSKRKTVIYCILVWVISIIPVSFGLRSGEEHWKENDIIFFSIITVFEFLIAIIVVEYIFVFRQLRAMWLQSKSRVVYIHDKESTSCIQGNNQTSDVQREYQATLVVICLVVVLVITVLPYQIAAQIALSCVQFTKCSDHTTEFLNNFMWYYFPIELLNFAINPIVYAWRLPKYKKAFLVTFGLQKKREDFGKTEQTILMSNNGNNGRNCLSRSSP